MRRKRTKQLDLFSVVSSQTGTEIAPADPERRREVVEALAELLLAVATGSTPASKEVDDEPEDYR